MSLFDAIGAAFGRGVPDLPEGVEKTDGGYVVRVNPRPGRGGRVERIHLNLYPTAQAERQKSQRPRSRRV